MNGARPALRNHRGQALTEAAMVLPILIILTMGIIEVARAFLYANLLTHAAREGARAAAVAGSGLRDSSGIFQNASAIHDLVQEYVHDSVPGAQVDVNVQQRLHDGIIPVVDVVVVGQFDTVFGLIGDGFAINRRVTFRDEGRR